MAIDLVKLSEKISRYRQQLATSQDEMARKCGMEVSRLDQIEKGAIEPTGDEILIIADYFRCDYRFFISNEKLNAFEQTDTLFRRYGTELSKNDRWAIQECLFLAECENYLNSELRIEFPLFEFTPKGTYYKGHGTEGSVRLRKHLKYERNAVPLDLFKDVRSIGIKVFRRRFDNSDISGVFIKHPTVGNCILVNYDEDAYRQRFTVAHEAGHAIFDADDEVSISFTKWDKSDLKEIRANSFASGYLFPQEFVETIPDRSHWDVAKILTWSNRLRANPVAFGIALKNLDYINEDQNQLFKNTRIPPEQKVDAELLNAENATIRERKEAILESGLSTDYVRKCFVAFEAGLITKNRMSEMLLTDPVGLGKTLELFSLRVQQ